MHHELETTRKPDLEPKSSYRLYAEQELARRHIDYLSYNEAGDLCLCWAGGETRIIDLLDEKGSALEVVNNEVVTRRCTEWISLTDAVSKEVGFNGGFDYFYASKANMTARVVLSALRAGWNFETSSPQDFQNLAWLIENGLVDKNIRVVSNGIKSSRYLETIIAARSLGVHVTPIVDNLRELGVYLDRGEEASVLPVGLRMKYGKVGNEEELAALSSQFGMSWEQILEAAEAIRGSSKVELTTLHAMVTGGKKADVQMMVDSLLFAGKKYFELKKQYPNLSRLDIGGGIPSFIEDFDHREFLRQFLSGIQTQSLRYGLTAPEIVFEMGSFAASEAQFNILQVIDRKTNRVNALGNNEEWLVVNSGIMQTVPDTLITDRQFLILAANCANEEVGEFGVCDLTCDTDGKLPWKIMLPKTNRRLFFIILGTGNYQDQLVGEQVNHCAIRQPAERVFVRGRWDPEIPNRDEQAVRRALGYSIENLPMLIRDFGQIG